MDIKKCYEELEPVTERVCLEYGAKATVIALTRLLQEAKVVEKLEQEAVEAKRDRDARRSLRR